VDIADFLPCPPLYVSGTTGDTISGMQTTELTVTVQHGTATAARAYADQRGLSLSALTDRALRNYLIAEALRTEPATDREWLDAVAQTVDGPRAA
jgi:hypothetical protein